MTTYNYFETKIIQSVEISSYVWKKKENKKTNTNISVRNNLN